MYLPVSGYTMIDSAGLYMITWIQTMILCFNIHSALLLLLLFIAMIRTELYSDALQNKKNAGFVCQICIWSNIKKKGGKVCFHEDLL